jgi:hypothetical protein
LSSLLDGKEIFWCVGRGRFQWVAGEEGDLFLNPEFKKKGYVTAKHTQTHTHWCKNMTEGERVN